MNRRTFLQGALLAAVGCAGGNKTRNRDQTAASSPDDDLAAAQAAQGARADKADKPLKILLLGGTGFLGPHLVETGRARGHTFTLFNRGKTHPELFPDVEKLRGDRNGQLDALKGRSWDACIDTSGYVPRLVTLSAELLANAVKQYVFVSSISVFPDDVKAGADESTPVQTLPEPGSEDVRKYYGPLKALCEQAAEKAMPGRATTVRPGLIVGPGDPTDRYTYWPVRVDRGGEILAPGSGKDPAQYIDARDLAAWMIALVERGTMGTFNATGPAQPLTMAGLLEACGARNDQLTWVPEKFLEEQKVSAWTDLPVWTGGDGGFAQIDAHKAQRAGLRFRPAAETARDTLAWWKTLPEARRAKLRAGLDAAREAAVLAAWKAKR